MFDLLFLIKSSLLIISMLLVGYFAGNETALMSITTIILSRLKEKYPKKTRYLEYWEQNPNHILTAILIGTNLACIAAGVLSTSLAIDLSKFNPLYKWLFPAAVILTILLFGEILPKVYSRYNHEHVSISNIVPLVRFSRLLIPLSGLFVNLSEKVMRLIGISHTRETPFLTYKELKLLLSVADQASSSQAVTSDMHSSSDTISLRQRKMLTNILSFVDRRILQVMRPRSEIFAIDAAQKMEDIITQILSSEYSRIPVYRRSIDNIIGIIYTKDLTITLRNRKLFLLDDIIRPAYFVPENASVSNILREFKKGRQHMAIAVDEYGTTVGLVTIEDLVEEIVGEIYDEYDVEEKKIIQMPDNSWVVFGDETITNLNEKLGSKLYSPDVITINGLIMTKLGRIPNTGETLAIGGLKIEIIESDSRRIKKLKIRGGELVQR